MCGEDLLAPSEDFHKWPPYLSPSPPPSLLVSTLAAGMVGSARPVIFRPLTRLPAVLFPHQTVSFAVKKRGGGAITATPFDLPQELIDRVWSEHEGRLAVFPPGGARVGTEVHLMYDDVLDALKPTPPNVAHAVGGDRVRLSRTVRNSDSDHPLCELLPLEDEPLVSAARLERLEDEAAAARELVERGTAQGILSLESSTLDEEVGGADVCDPRCHPLFPIQSQQPTDPSELSLWLGAHLPLSTGLRVAILSALCPLRRMQDIVDALRLLLDPQRGQRRGHRFRVVSTPPASDAHCSGAGGGAELPRLVITEAPPTYTSWASPNAFPHG